MYGTSKIFVGQVHYGHLLVPGQVHYGHLLVPGQVENFTISTPLLYILLLFSGNNNRSIYREKNRRKKSKMSCKGKFPWEKRFSLGYNYFIKWGLTI